MYMQALDVPQAVATENDTLGESDPLLDCMQEATIFSAASSMCSHIQES